MAKETIKEMLKMIDAKIEIEDVTEEFDKFDNLSSLEDKSINTDKFKSMKELVNEFMIVGANS